MIWRDEKFFFFWDKLTLKEKECMWSCTRMKISSWMKRWLQDYEHVLLSSKNLVPGKLTTAYSNRARNLTFTWTHAIPVFVWCILGCTVSLFLIISVFWTSSLLLISTVDMVLNLDSTYSDVWDLNTLLIDFSTLILNRMLSCWYFIICEFFSEYESFWDLTWHEFPCRL